MNKAVCIIDTDINQSSSSWAEKRGVGLAKIAVFIGHSEKLLQWLLPVLRNQYDYIIIDGCPSNRQLTKNIIKLSNLVLIPFLPSPVDREITQQFIKECLNQDDTKVLVGTILNQKDSSIWSKEYPIILKGLDKPPIQLNLRKKNLYKKLQFSGKALRDEEKKRTNSDMSALCNAVDRLLKKQNTLQLLIDF